MEKEYIKYSIRHDIKDPRIARLFDYIERVAAWDIVGKIPNSDSGSWWISNGLYDHENTTGIFFPYGPELKGEYVHMYHKGKKIFSEMPLDVFMGSYQTLIPLARDYAKK